ncbi:MAG: type II secretion system protein GspL [Gammaproteobacteria bacterium]
MPETLVIRLPEDLEQPVHWTVIDDAGTRIGAVGAGTLSDAANQRLTRDVLALVPGTQTVSTHAQLPVKSASKMLQVVPFALEEHLAGDVTRMHFAIGERNDDGEVAVTAVRKDRMQGWVDALHAADLMPTMMVPDVAGMPRIDNGYTVLLGENEACIRDPEGVACYVDLESLPDLLELMSAAPEAADEGDTDDMPGDAPVVVFFEDSQDPDSLLENIKGKISHAEFRRLPAGTLPRLAAEILERPSPSLLQGDFSPRGQLDKLWKPWKTVGILALVLLFTSVSFKAAELMTYKSRYKALRAEINELYQSKVPDAVVGQADPVGDVRRRLRGGGAQGAASDFLDGLSVLAKSKKSDKTYLEGISFSNGLMNIEIIAPNVPTLDTLRIAISDVDGWEAKLTQTRDKDNVVEGRLQLQRSAP